MVLYWTSSQEYSAKAGISQGFILDPKIFLLYIIDLPGDVNCSVVIVYLIIYFFDKKFH